MPDGRMCYVDGVVRIAGNDVQNIVADDWQCLRLERSSLPDTAALCCRDISGLLHQACTVPGLLYQASVSRHIESVTVHGHTCVLPLTRRAAAISTHCSLLVADLGELASTTLQ